MATDPSDVDSVPCGSHHLEVTNVNEAPDINAGDQNSRTELEIVEQSPTLQHKWAAHVMRQQTMLTTVTR